MDNILLSDQYSDKSVSHKRDSQSDSVPVMETPLQHAQLDKLAVKTESDLGVTLIEQPVTGLLVLRAREATAALESAVTSAVQLKLPEKLQSTANDQFCIRWMAPDEWLLSCPIDACFGIEQKLHASVGDASVAVTNVSGGYTSITLKGSKVLNVLRKSTAYDVHPVNYGPGKVVNTVFAKAQVCMRCIDENTYELLVRRSFADYVWHWLQVASTEYGLSIDAPKMS